ncbi:hypothetical protein A4R27_23985 [Priestia endophytica]|nr:hypothetical protein A4R27_23985 [Priestia endophytica]
MLYLPFYFAYFMTLSIKGDVRAGSRVFLNLYFYGLFSFLDIQKGNYRAILTLYYKKRNKRIIKEFNKVRISKN